MSVAILDGVVASYSCKVKVYLGDMLQLVNHPEHLDLAYDLPIFSISVVKQPTPKGLTGKAMGQTSVREFPAAAAVTM